MSYPMLGMPQGAEWFIILAIVILVFGAAKLPDLARSTGQALKIFKSETKGLIDDDKDKDKAKDTSKPVSSTDGTDVTVAGELPPASGEATTDASTTSTERHPG
ncbi:Sec-independent protein translocase protein TatA [Nocardioides aquaticus]|jgi:sec-independent protein translocase protein TatA|uniref:Sec-independent protein translocase protein TatA n=1 Tax=Nocardioides aquaticus TaxID=160826 RepID=A0ABX8EI40_9ACTN|nr:Sec-independent protein translocase subunit TatA [Nocardioides aquaticus]QVT80006.1 Sec-independent protein translocase protein TatA [Nocardioides aquaticus]